MQQETENVSRLTRAIVQRLASLQGAGMSHLPRAAVAATPLAFPPVCSANNTRQPAAEGLASPEKPSRAVPPPARKATEDRHTPQAEAVLSAVPSEAPADRVAALAAVASRVAACKRCAELARTRTQTVFGVGNPHTRLVFLGEAPGADEDRQGEPFVGAAGQLLTDIITKGMKLRREDVYIMNILRCRPPGNRTPLPIEAAACREYLDAQLAIIQPEFICCLGGCAAQNLLGSTATIGHLRGRWHTYQGIKVLCTYHPSYLLRCKDDERRFQEEKRKVWNDIQILMAEMGSRK